MAFLVVGGLTIPVSTDGAQTKSPERGGSESRAWGGNLRSTTRWTKRGWQFTSTLLLEADAAAIEALVAPGDYLDCTGDALGGATVSCLVTVGDAPIMRVAAAAGTFRRRVVLTLREV